MMLYLELNTRPDISFSISQCARFTHNTKTSHEMDVNRICHYLQGTKDNGLVFNLSKKLVVGFYYDAYFSGLWGHENSQSTIFDRSITVFLVFFSNFPLLCVSKIHTEIALSTLHYEYVEFSHYVISLLTLKVLSRK